MTIRSVDSLFRCLPVLVTLLILGCGPSDPTKSRHAVYGTIMKDGKPVEHGSISFLPKTRGPAASTVIEDGEYEFTSSNGPYPGQYRVVIGIEWHNPDGSRKENAPPPIPKPEPLQPASSLQPVLPPPPERSENGKLVPLEDPKITHQRAVQRQIAERKAKARREPPPAEPERPKTQWELTHEVAMDGDDQANFELEP